MQLDFFGVPMHITPGNVILAALVTFVIFLIHNFFRSIKKFVPFKDDRLANESLFFIYMIRKDYFNDYQGFLVDNRDEFSKKLWQISMIFDIHRMQKESYRTQFQGLLNRHHGQLREAYMLFHALRSTQQVDRLDVSNVVKRTHEILNVIILDINKEFKDVGRPAA